MVVEPEASFIEFDEVNNFIRWKEAVSSNMGNYTVTVMAWVEMYSECVLTTHFNLEVRTDCSITTEMPAIVAPSVSDIISYVGS